MAPLFLTLLCFLLTSAAIIFNHSDTCAIPPERIPPGSCGKNHSQSFRTGPGTELYWQERHKYDPFNVLLSNERVREKML